MLEVLHIQKKFVLWAIFFMAAILNFRDFQELPEVAACATKS